MEILYLLILLLTVIVLAYKRVPLLVAMAIMVGLTVFWTELRHLIYVPGWFRFANGIVAVILIGFSIKPSRRLLISDRLYGWFRKSLPQDVDHRTRSARCRYRVVGRGNFLWPATLEKAVKDATAATQRAGTEIPGWAGRGTVPHAR